MGHSSFISNKAILAVMKNMKMLADLKDIQPNLKTISTKNNNVKN